MNEFIIRIYRLGNSLIPQGNALNALYRNASLQRQLSSSTFSVYVVYAHANRLNCVIAKLSRILWGSQVDAFSASGPDPLNQEDGDEREEKFLDKS